MGSESSKLNEVEMVFMGEAKMDVIWGHQFVCRLKELGSRHEELTWLINKFNALLKYALINPITKEDFIKHMKLCLFEYHKAIGEMETELENLISATRPFPYFIFYFFASFWIFFCLNITLFLISKWNNDSTALNF